MTLTITSLYIAVLALMMIGLSIRVTMTRAKTGISILHGEDMDLAAQIRRHGNFIENVPMALLLMAAAELNGAPAGLLHAAGLILLVSRVLHPLGIQPDKGAVPARIVGGTGTWVSMLLCIGFIVWSAL